MYERREVITAEYAGFLVRLVAHLIDGVVLTALSLAISSIIHHFWGADDGQVIQVAADASSSAVNMVAAVIDVALSLVYAVTFWAWQGQTPGKMVMGVKIVRTDGSPIGVGRAVLRYVGYIVSGLMLGLGYVWIAFDSHKQGVHDKIADTYVIRQPRQRKTVQFYG